MALFDDWNGYDNWRLDNGEKPANEDTFVCDICYIEHDRSELVEVDGKELCSECALKELNNDDDLD